MARKFFELRSSPSVDPEDVVPVRPEGVRFSQPRAIVGSAERISSGKNGEKRVDKRPAQAWQQAAWRAYESIGEVHFSINLIGQIMSRVRLFAGVVTDYDQPPVNVDDYLRELEQDAGEPAPETRDAVVQARTLVHRLLLGAVGGTGGMLSSMAANLSVPGELYLVEKDAQWLVASTDELVQQGTKYSLQSTRQTSGVGKRRGDALDPDAFIARVWRSHPRYSGEPDSSMLGVLDACEELILLEQAVRSITRSRMAAGLTFIPEGIASFRADPDEESVEDAITRATLSSVEDESSQATVVPLILKGPPELGDKIRWIEYARKVDAELVALIDRTLDRVLQGIDVPKEMVAGLANVRYSNAVVVDDNLYKQSIEPMVLLCCDALTSVYLRPQLVRQLDVTPEQLSDPDNIVNRLVFWADVSAVVTRPDRSSAANDGFDRRVLSAEAWRSARGFSDQDQPSGHELLTRAVLERGQLTPDVVQALLKLLDPTTFEQPGGGQGLPEDIASLFEPAPPELTEPVGGQPTPPAPPSPQTPAPVESEGTAPHGTGFSENAGGTPAPVPPSGRRGPAAPAR